MRFLIGFLGEGSRRYHQDSFAHNFLSLFSFFFWGGGHLLVCPFESLPASVLLFRFPNWQLLLMMSWKVCILSSSLSNQFSKFFWSCLQICTWYLVHCFTMTNHRSNSNFVLVHWIFTELQPLDLVNSCNNSVLCTFVAMLTDIHLIFGTLLYYDKLLIKFKFGFGLSWGHWFQKIHTIT